MIDELFALDRNMEAVLDECGVRLSHDLVVDMLQRFKHASRRSGSFVGLGRGLGLIMILELITA